MKISRREIIKAGGVVLAVSGASAPAGCGNDVEAAPLAQPITVDANGIAAVPYQMYPDLQHAGGALTVPLVAPQNPTVSAQPPKAVLVINRGHDRTPQFMATTSACPHAGCPLGYNVRDDLVECPCHSSRFFTQAMLGVSGSCAGAVENPPARAPLSVWQTSFDGASFVSIDFTQPGGCTSMLPPVVGGKVTLKVSDFPALATVGGSIVGTPQGAGGPIALVRRDPATVVCLDATCTHMQCPVAFSEANNDLECPCHGSRFDLTGAVLVGPATVALKVHPTTFDVTTIVVTLA